MDYYVHAAFRDAVLGKRKLDYDVYKAMETTAPDEVRSLLERTGARREDLVGRIRSITFRAVRPA